jgi:glycosyltransferase involved in cell wall biosynthesis
MRLAVATSFPVDPPRSGGQQRIHGLYSALGRRGVETEIVALVDQNARGGVREIAPGVRELRIPKSPEHDSREFIVMQQAGVPVTDLVLATSHDLTPEYGEALAGAASGAEAIVVSHPYTHPAVRAAGLGPVIYEAHNVEYDLKAGMYRDEALTEVVRTVEADACREAAAVLVCSAEDGARLGDLYGSDPAHHVLVPNGTEARTATYVGREEREARRGRLGMGPTALFLGSWHEPNVVAARDILRAAEQLPDVRFVIVGSVGMALAAEDIPSNVDVCGMVDAGFVRAVLGVADIALNPMRSGSGTNLKMLDYALAGVPVISSPVGARGLGMSAGEHYVAAETSELGEAIADLLAEDPRVVDARCRAAEAVVHASFTWDAIAERYAAALDRLPAGAAS